MNITQIIRTRFATGFTAIALVAGPAHSQNWFENLRHDIDNGVKNTFGHVDVDHGGTVHPPQVIVQAGREIAGNALAQAIWFSKSRIAIQPVPSQIAQDLMQLGVQPGIIQRARYSTDWGASANGTIQQFLLGNEMAGAVTLDEVIIFRDGRMVGDLALWAHELKHVEQYARMGVQEFAKHYVENSNELEAPAYAEGNRVGQVLAQWSQASQRGAQGGGQQMTQGAYYNIQGGFYVVDGGGLAYPADPNTGQAVGQAVARLVTQTGNQAMFLDGTNQRFLGARVR